MFSGPTGNLFCIFTNVVFTSSFEHIYVITFAHSHIVYTRNKQK